MARLGYDRYGAQGGDWGSSVTAGPRPAATATHVAGIHLNMPPLAPPDPAMLDDLTRRSSARSPRSTATTADWDSGYSQAAVDPPADARLRPRRLAGRAVRVDPREVLGVDGLRRRPENVLTRDELLDNVMLYWLPGTGASSARLYWESFEPCATSSRGRRRRHRRPHRLLDLPEGDLPRPSRRWAEQRFTDIRYWNELPTRRPLRRLRAAGAVRRRGARVLPAGPVSDDAA